MGWSIPSKMVSHVVIMRVPLSEPDEYPTDRPGPR